MACCLGPGYKGLSVHVAPPIQAGLVALVSSFAITIHQSIGPAPSTPHPREGQAMGLPTGLMSTARDTSLPAQLAPGKSRISTACFTLPSFTALPVFFLSPSPAHGEWADQSDLDLNLDRAELLLIALEKPAGQRPAIALGTFLGSRVAAVLVPNPILAN